MMLKENGLHVSHQTMLLDTARAAQGGKSQLFQ